jgi:hypothetical protein
MIGSAQAQWRGRTEERKGNPSTAELSLKGKPKGGRVGEEGERERVLSSESFHRNPHFRNRRV